MPRAIVRVCCSITHGKGQGRQEHRANDQAPRREGRALRWAGELYFSSRICRLGHGQGYNRLRFAALSSGPSVSGAVGDPKPPCQRQWWALMMSWPDRGAGVFSDFSFSYVCTGTPESPVKQRHGSRFGRLPAEHGDRGCRGQSASWQLAWVASSTRPTTNPAASSSSHPL